MSAYNLESDRLPRADARLKSLPAETRERLWAMRHPEDDGADAHRLVDVRAWLEANLGLRASITAISEFYKWERIERRMAAARSRAGQAAQLLAADPGATPEDVARLGQMVFTAEMVEGGDVKSFVALERLRLQAAGLEHDARRIALLERKAARLDELERKAREIGAAGGLSDETLELLEKQLKLL